MSNTSWTIAKTNNGKTYYIAGIVPETQEVQWTTKRENSLKFESEGTVVNYLNTQLNNRKDVYVLCLNSLYPFY